jgi:nesprin-1
VKKCDQALTDHLSYLDKYKQCSERLTAAQQLYQSTRNNLSGTRQELSSHIQTIHDVLARQSSTTILMNTTVEAGERLYSSTGDEGREIIRQQLLDLQQALETLYDNVMITERETQAKLSNWTGFDESSEAFENWLKHAEIDLKSDIELKTTLDEKRAQLQIYRTFLHDTQTHQQDLFDLRDKADCFPECTEKIKKVLNDLNKRHAIVLKRAGTFVERYN